MDKPIDEAVVMLEALQERWCASTAGKPGARRIATFDAARAAQGEDDFDNEVSATRRCASDLALAIERIRALTAAQQHGQAVAFDIERARTLADYVVGYARAVELKSLSSDACVALRDLHSMLHAQPMQQGGGEVVADYSGCCDTPAYCSSVRRCTAKDTTPPSAPVGVEAVVASLRECELFLRTMGLESDAARRVADDARSALHALAQQPAAVDEARPPTTPPRRRCPMGAAERLLPP